MRRTRVSVLLLLSTVAWGSQTQLVAEALFSDLVVPSKQQQVKRIAAYLESKLALVSDEVTTAYQGLAGLAGKSPQSDLRSPAYIRKKVVEIRAKINLGHGRMASLDAPRTEQELREELFGDLQDQWKEILGKAAPAMGHPTKLPERASALRKFVTALLTATTYRDGYERLVKTDAAALQTCVELDKRLGLIVAPQETISHRSYANHPMAVAPQA